MGEIKSLKTPFEQAERDGVGLKCLKQAKEDQARRKEASVNSTYQAAKEMATYFYHTARGKVFVLLDNPGGEKAMNYEEVFGHS